MDLSRLQVLSAFVVSTLLLLVAGPTCRAQAPTSAQLQNYSGEYTDLTEPDTPYDVYVDNGKLTVE
jgi:hypothetical protein